MKKVPSLCFYVFMFYVLPLSLTSCDQKRLQFPQFFAGFVRSSWGICSDKKRFISTGASAASDAVSVLEKDPQGNVPTRVGEPFDGRRENLRRGHRCGRKHRRIG